MHHIQKNIILNLARTSPLRFTQLQPPRVPNNTFSYHLKQLVASGYVELTSDGYTATRKALKTVAYGVSGTNKTPDTPKVISMVYVENIDGEVLLVNRNHRPFHGWYCLPSGLMLQGETLEQAAHREIFEKATIATQETLPHAGVLDVRYIEQRTGDIFMHTVAFIYSYKFTGDKDELAGKVTRYGELTWSTLDREDILPEVQSAKKIIDAGYFTYDSVTFDEPLQKPIITELFADEKERQTPEVKYKYRLAIRGLHANINPHA